MARELWWDSPQHAIVAQVELLPSAVGSARLIPRTRYARRARTRRPMRKLNPTPHRRCPFPDCPSHENFRSKGIVRHGYMKSRNGARLRLLCPACKRTFCNRRGTAYYRLRHPRRTFDQFASLLTEGLSA